MRHLLYVRTTHDVRMRHRTFSIVILIYNRLGKMADVKIEYFPDRRLKVLLHCKVGDKNFWHDSASNSYTICLDEDTIFLLFETYLALNNYNNWKRLS